MEKIFAVCIIKAAYLSLLGIFDVEDSVFSLSKHFYKTEKPHCFLKTLFFPQDFDFSNLLMFDLVHSYSHFMGAFQNWLFHYVYFSVYTSICEFQFVKSQRKSKHT